MSILIKNMKIPSSCTMCWLNTFCGVWNEEPVKNKGFNERLENCPLTELIRCKDCRNKEDCQWHYYSDDDYGYCKWAERRGEEEWTK